MIDHVRLGSPDLYRARSFYCAILEVIGWRLIQDECEAGWLCWAPPSNAPKFLLHHRSEPVTLDGSYSVCFRANSRAEVDTFYRVALEHGGKGEGAPGAQVPNSPGCYGIEVRDLDGNMISCITLATTTRSTV